VEAFLLEQTRVGPQDARAVLRVDAALPEVGTVEIFVAVVAKQVLDVLADEGRRVVACGPEAVDDGGGAGGRMVGALARRRARLRSLISLQEPTTSAGWPSSSRIRRCSSATQQ